MEKTKEYIKALEGMAKVIEHEMQYFITNESWNFSTRNAAQSCLEKRVDKFIKTHHDYLCHLDNQRLLNENKLNQIKGKTS